MRRFALLLIGLVACDDDTSNSNACRDVAERVAVTSFHGDDRSGAYPTADLAEVGRVGAALRWRSEPLDALEVDGVVYPPLIYASPLFVPDQSIVSDIFEGRADVVYTATSNGWVYAIEAGGCEPGRVLWRNRVSDAVPIERLDQGVPMGVLSTPVIDLEADRLYVSAHDARAGWQLHALSLTDGRSASGWPVTIDDASLAAVNTNGPARFHDSTEMSQRGALAMSPSGDQVYVAFGTYWGSGAGWLVAVDTEEPRVRAAFSSAPSIEDRSNGGIWGSAGPHVDANGQVWATTGNSPPGFGAAPGVWGNSLLQLDAELDLQRAYTPFNYCALDQGNMDLGASQPLRLQPLRDSTTPNLLAFGGKQGVVYLVDSDAVKPAGEGRGPCSHDASTDGSLLAPLEQPHFEGPGPLSVFGPYSEEFGEIDHAKMRTKLAEWTDPAGQRVLFASGTAKAAEDSTVSVAPSIAKLNVALADDGSAYLEVGAINEDVVMLNPGSPIVTGVGERAIVWVLDRNALRTAPLLHESTATPRLYAFSATDLRLLWSGETAGPSGKYGSPIGVGDTLVVGTDRIEAWAAGPPSDDIAEQP